ncbi:MAG: hypothetical protein IKK63_01095 [Clostridia bacterium]|nr:hypothetical protein [Clostridia bacterium]MBR3818072.1 hypothetical protein [Clostridia bacterium]
MSVSAVITVAGIAGLAVTFLLGFSFVPFIGKLEFGNTFDVREKRKPVVSSGGIILAIGTVSAVVLAVATDRITGGDIVVSGSLVGQEMYTKLWSGILMALSFSLVGLIDDYFKIKTQKNLGVPVKQKAVMQFFVILAYLTGLYMGMNGKPYMFVPFFGNTEPGFFYWIIGIILIYAAVNAVDITDGVNGLCGGVTLTAAVSLGIIAAIKGFFGFTAMSAALAGSCAGFILLNGKSLKINIGRTGTMFLGGMLVAISYAIGCPIILFLSGLSFFVIGATDVIQIIYYKRTGGRPLFKSAPVQHHLKLNGWSDKKITLTFTALNIFGGVAAVAAMYFGGYILR